MKKWSGIIAVSAFGVFAVADTIHGFITNETISYYSEQPHQWLIVASVGIVGGLAALFFERLSPRSRRSLKLYTLGLIASLLTIFTGYFLAEFAALTLQFGASEFRRAFILVPVCLGAIIVLLWIEFYQVYKRRVE